MSKYEVSGKELINTANKARFRRITQPNNRRKLGIQFILVTTDYEVVTEFNGFRNIVAYN